MLSLLRNGSYLTSFSNFKSLITGKSDADPYYCCNDLNVNQLFKQWGEWGACVIEGKDCGCVDGDEENCGIRTRKRELKCPMVNFILIGYDLIWHGL